MSSWTAFSLLPRLADVPVDPDRSEARRWVTAELSRQEYQDARPSLIEQLLTWIQERLAAVHVGFDSPVQMTVAVLAGLALAAAGYALWRSGGVRRQFRRRGRAALPARSSSAAEHRAAAERYAEQGRWDSAVLERFRAIARELSERALVPAAPGATAAEVAEAGGTALPELATDLRAAAGTFDDICYGHLPLSGAAGQRAEAFLRELDERVRIAPAAAPLVVPADRAVSRS